MAGPQVRRMKGRHRRDLWQSRSCKKGTPQHVWNRERYSITHKVNHQLVLNCIVGIHGPMCSKNFQLSEPFRRWTCVQRSRHEPSGTTMNMVKKLMVGLENLNDGVILEICDHQLLTSRINQLKIPQDDISKKFANHGHIGNTLSFKHPAVTMDADALVWSLRELCCPQDFDGEVVSWIPN